jgi:hypothetical protein
LFTTTVNHGLTVLEPFTLTGFSTPTGFVNGQTLFAAAILSNKTFTANGTATTTAVTAFSATGTGTLTTLAESTPLIDVRATGSQVRSTVEELASVGAGNVSVVAVPGSSYRLAFTGLKSSVQLAQATITATSIVPVYGKSATLDFATVTLANAISGSATLSAVLEVESTEGAVVETLCQSPVTLINDIIEAGSVTPVTGTSVFTLLSPDSSTWEISIDDSGALTAEKQ